VYAIVRSRKRFQALRDFTLESGQEELERQNQQRKEDGEDLTRTSSIDSLRSPTVARTPTLGNVPEEDSAFAIGDDDDSDADDSRPSEQPRSPVHSISGASRSASIASSVEDSVPLQLRGMSEKARGKMPVGQPAFSRQNSMTSLHSVAGPALATNEFFTPTVQWVSLLVLSMDFANMSLVGELADRTAAAHHPNANIGAWSEDAQLRKLQRYGSSAKDYPRDGGARY
jgi:hypothetical protein